MCKRGPSTGTACWHVPGTVPEATPFMVIGLCFHSMSLTGQLFRLSRIRGNKEYSFEGSIGSCYSSVLPLLSLSEIGNEGTRASRKGSFGQMHLLIALGPGVARVSKDKLDCQGNKCEGCYSNLKSWGLCCDRGWSWRLVAERIWG